MTHFIFFHGIGIRSPFWNSIVPILDKKSVNYSLIDLDFSSLDSAFESSITSVKDIIQKYPDRDIVIVGHSLGGLFATYVAQTLGDDIHKLILVASGVAPKQISVKAIQQKQINKLYKWVKKLGIQIMFKGYLPDWLTQSMFFTKNTPKEAQMKLWRDSVREKQSFLMEYFQSKTIWNDYFKRVHFSGPDNVLIIICDKDKLVPKHASIYLKDHLNGSFKVYEDCGHNDIVTSDKFNKKFVNDIVVFSSIS